MKIIDLLNKIANGEEVSQKIKYQNYEYEFNKLDKEYQRWCNGLNYGLGEDRRLDIILDDEVEILEEEKRIPEKLIKLNNVSNSSDLTALSQMQWENNKLIENKINEIIDYLKSEGDE